jgi:LuxR family maltose regulon positive regulatory protein
MASAGPALPAAFVPRPRLLVDLVGWRDLRLISLVTPTGYGKSTFIAWWLKSLDALPADDRPLSAWLSLEPAGLPVDVVLLRLTEPLRPHLPSIDDLLERHAAGRLSPSQFAQALCTDLARLALHFIVVVDDVHLVTDPDVRALLQTILDADAPNLHLVLLSRTQPSLRISRLLLKSAALLLDDSHLRFDHEEFLAFSRATRLASLDAARLAAIEERCEGWVAALQLLALSPPRSIDSLLDARSGHLLLEHLEAEVFSQLPAELRAFLVDVAPLPFLTADLVAEATRCDKRSAARLLQQALDANVFLTAFTHRPAQGTTQVRCRFHPLFRELLQHKLLDDADPAAVHLTVQRAAAWLAAAGEIDAALALLLPDCLAAAVDVVAAHLRPAILRFDLVSAQRWLDQLPPRSIDAHPQIAVDAAWLAFFLDRNDLSTPIARAQAALAAQAADAELTAEFTAELGALRALSLFIQGRRSDAHAAADDAARSPHRELGLAAGYLDLIDVLLRDKPEDLDERLRRIHHAIDVFTHLGFAYAALDAYIWPCFLKRLYGDAPGMVIAHENALAMLHHFGRENTASAADFHFAFGQSLYLMDRIAEARAQFESAIVIAERVDPAGMNSYHTLLGLQLCDLTEGRPPQRYDPADDARRWAAITSDNTPMLAVNIGWTRLLRDLRLGAPERCRQTADSFGITPAQLTPDTHELLRLLVLGGAVVGGSTDPQLGARLCEFQADMHAVRNVPLASYAGALRVLYLLNSGDLDAAHAEVHSLGAYVERSGMPRLLADFPQCAALRETNAEIEACAPFGLSRREMCVLEMLADERANKEIAAALSISLATVKTHVQHIFRKLEVRDRAAAVHKLHARSKANC